MNGTHGRMLLILVLLACTGISAGLLLFDAPPPEFVLDRGRDRAAPPPAAGAERDAPVRTQPAPEPPGPATVTGILLEADLRPARAIVVQLVTIPERTVEPTLAWLFGDGSPELWSPGSTSVTDAEGRYSLRAPASGERTWLRIDPRGPRAALFGDLPNVPQDGILDHGRLILPERRVVAGEVHDDRGRPIAGATVRLLPEFRFPWEVALADLPDLLWIVSRPDTGGRFTVVPAPPALTGALDLLPTPTTRTDEHGRYRLELSGTLGGTLTADAPGFARAFGTLDGLGPGRFEAPELLLTPEGSLTGTVRGADGARRARVQVAAGVLDHDEGGLVYAFTETYEDGGFRLRGLLPEPHAIFLRQPGDHDWAHVVTAAPGDPLRLVLPARPALSVTVVDRAGAPLDAVVAVLPLDDGRDPFEAALWPAAPVPAAGGRVRIPGLTPGRYRVYARTPGFAIGTDEVDLTMGSRAAAVALAPAATLDVRVCQGTSGRPVAGVTVHARPAGEASVRDTGRLLEQLTAATTAVDGRARLTGLVRGRYRLDVRHPNYAHQIRHVDVPGDVPTIGLPPGGTVDGRLVLRGQPLAGQRVVLREDDPGALGRPYRRIAMSASDGSFRFPGLPGGRYLLELRLASGVVTVGDLPYGTLADTEPDLTRPLAVRPGHVTTVLADLDRAFSGRRAVRGRVLRHGRPWAGQPVQAWTDAPDEGWAAAGVTDADGRFLLGAVNRAEVTLQVAGEQHFLGLEGAEAVVTLAER